MLFKKGSRGDGSLLQNQFTAYLVTSLRRRKKDIIQARIRHDQREVYVDLEEVFYALRSTDAPLDELVCDEPTSFDDMYFENKRLERALWNLTERDRYVLFARALAERSFEELSAELGLSYKGIAAVYSRAIQKLKKEMEDAEKMKFKDLLLRAKSGDQDAIHTILEMYRPLLLKESIVLGVFDEDLYQELCMTVVHCIEVFKV